MELPEGWKDFGIVETSDGCFTGRVTIKDSTTYPGWDTPNDPNRIILSVYTRKFLEEKIGMKIERYTERYQ